MASFPKVDNIIQISNDFNQGRPLYNPQIRDHAISQGIAMNFRTYSEVKEEGRPSDYSYSAGGLIYIDALGKEMKSKDEVEKEWSDIDRGWDDRRCPEYETLSRLNFRPLETGFDPKITVICFFGVGSMYRKSAESNAGQNTRNHAFARKIIEKIIKTARSINSKVSI